MRQYKKEIMKQHSLWILQAWYKEDEEEASTISTIAIHIIRDCENRVWK